MPNSGGARAVHRWLSSAVRVPTGRVLVALWVVLVLLGSTACAARSSGAEDARPTVLTTFTVLADMVRNVSGERVRVESITRVGAEIHQYEPTPDDLIRGADADLIIDNGLGLEAWFEQFLTQVDAPRVTASEGVDTVPITSGDYRGAPNPHAWMSPANAQIYVENIRAALTELDPAGAEVYRANAETYAAEIAAINEDLHEALSVVPESQRALVTCEGAFSYLARDVGLTERYLWPVNAETEATPQQIAAVVEFVNRNQVPTVFCETTVNDAAQRQVARETGARLGKPLYVDSLSGPEGPVPTYVELLRYDAEAIAAGLAGRTR